MTDPDPDVHARALAARHHDPTAWFEQLYAEAADGAAAVPWDVAHPSAAVAAWVEGQDVVGRRTVVVGCGYGRDAEFLAGRGADVVAFDISPSAIATARARHPESAVEYVAADALCPPATWSAGFAPVVENMNVQALPEPVRSSAIAAIGRLVAPGGTLLVVEAALDESEGAVVEPGPPWPLRRGEIEAFAVGGLRAVEIEGLRDPGQRVVRRWRAEFEKVGS